MWLHNLYSQTRYPGLTVLCLNGFDLDGSIVVRVAAGSFTATTTVNPVDGAPKSTSVLEYEEEPPTTLFEAGSTLRVYTKGYGGDPTGGPPGTFVSEMWRFLPPSKAREAMARSGSVTIVVSQGSRTARIVQPISVPNTQAYDLLGNQGRGRSRLILSGFPAGSNVPVGLYRTKDDNSENATLVRQVGRVKVPSSRVADFIVPEELLTAHPRGSYCLLPPTTRAADCQPLTQWPAFPGLVSPGDQGRRVSTWQNILIEAHVMSDIKDNHDGAYGAATSAAVAAHLAANGQRNPDGAGNLGKGLYRQLTGVQP